MTDKRGQGRRRRLLEGWFETLVLRFRTGSKDAETVLAGGAGAFLQSKLGRSTGARFDLPDVGVVAVIRLMPADQGPTARMNAWAYARSVLGPESKPGAYTTLFDACEEASRMVNAGGEPIRLVTDCLFTIAVNRRRHMRRRDDGDRQVPASAEDVLGVGGAEDVDGDP